MTWLAQRLGQVVANEGGTRSLRVKREREREREREKVEEEKKRQLAFKDHG
jgi:hypothetical protein